MSRFQNPQVFGPRAQSLEETAIMTGRTFAIGDIHGCAEALRALVQQIEPTPEDQIITLGDYVDRGPDSRDVIEQLIELRERCQLVSLLGNHEILMLSAFDSLENLQFWMRCGGSATLESYGADLTDISDRHLDFVRSCALYHEIDTHFFVHANYDPTLPLDQQPERLLFWEHLRFMPTGLTTIPGRHISDKTAVVGHSPQESGEILNLGDIICIDTYCVGSGCLTALEIPSLRCLQVDKYGEPFERK